MNAINTSSNTAVKAMKPQVQPRFVPSPYESLQGLDRAQPNARGLAEKKSIQNQAVEEILSPPTVQPREGSTTAILQNHKALAQDTFQRQGVQRSQVQEEQQTLPQRSEGLKGQLQQFSDATKSFLQNLDRLNTPNLVASDAQQARITAQAGRHQAERVGQKSIIQRLKEIPFVTKSDKQNDILRTPTKGRVQGGVPVDESNREVALNLGIGETEN